MSFPPGVKCWTPDGQDLGVRLRALDGTSNIYGYDGRYYNVGEDRTAVVHSKDVAALTAGGKFERVEDTSADKVIVRSYTASDLDGLTFPEAFHKFVIGPVAEAFQRFMFERGGLRGEDFLKDGSLFGPLLKHGRLGGIGSTLWPVDLDKLISRVPPSSVIRPLIRLIVERWGTLIEFLLQRELVATDIDDFPLPVGYWKRKGMSIDIENGDLFEVGKSEPVRVGLALSLAIPTTTAMSAPKAEIEALVTAGVTEPKARSSSAKAESQCRTWLGEQMRASPHERPMAKEDCLRAAVDKYPGLSERGFERAWARAIEETEARWNLPGRPKKSPQ